jgi:hypothetical protein
MPLKKIIACKVQTDFFISNDYHYFVIGKALLSYWSINFVVVIFETVLYKFTRDHFYITSPHFWTFSDPPTLRQQK